MRVLFAGVAAFALWNTLRQAELGRAAALAAAVGAPIALALLPYVAIIGCHAEAYRRVLGVLGHRVSFPRIYSVVLSTEAVLMSFPAGIAVSDSLNPYLLRRRCGIPIPDGLAGIAAKKSLIVLSNALYIVIALACGFRGLRLASERLLGFRGLEWIVAGSAIALFVMFFGMTKALVSGSLAARSHGLLRASPARASAASSPRRSRASSPPIATSPCSFASAAPRSRPPRPSSSACGSSSRWRRW